MFIRSARLFLRPAFPEDWQAIRRGIRDGDVRRMLPHAPLSGDENGVEENGQPAAFSYFPRFVITDPRESGAPVIGEISLEERDEDPALNFWIAREYRDQGYATEAGGAVVEIARMLGHRRIVAAQHIDNPAVGRVLAKLGFRPTGAVRPRFCGGRGGELVLIRRHALDLDAHHGDLEGRAVWAA